MHETTSGCASTRPTAFPKVNPVLATLVARISERLDGNFVGAYLHGSLAVGDFNSSSDIDVIVVIKRDLKQSEIASFQDLHRALFAELPPPCQRQGTAPCSRSFGAQEAAAPPAGFPCDGR